MNSIWVRSLPKPKDFVSVEFPLNIKEDYVCVSEQSKWCDECGASMSAHFPICCHQLRTTNIHQMMKQFTQNFMSLLPWLTMRLIALEYDFVSILSNKFMSLAQYETNFLESLPKWCYFLVVTLNYRAFDKHFLCTELKQQGKTLAFSMRIKLIALNTYKC